MRSSWTRAVAKAQNGSEYWIFPSSKYFSLTGAKDALGKCENMVESTWWVRFLERNQAVKFRLPLQVKGVP